MKPASRRPKEAGSPSPSPDRSRKRRLARLGVALAAALLLLFLTHGWRQRLLQDSARHRALIREVEARRRTGQTLADERAALQQQLAARPRDPEIRLQLAQLRWRLEGPAAALEVLETLPAPAGDPRIARMRAHCSRLTGREDRALAILDEAVRKFPRNGDLRADRAMLYVLLAWRGEAEREIQAAEVLGAQDLFLARATLDRARGDLSAARGVLQAARAERGADPEIIRQLAAVAQDAGQDEEAITLLSSLPAPKQSVEDRVTLAALFLHRKDPRGALESLAPALALAPGHPRARLLRARALRQAGREEEALRALEALRRERPRMFGLAFHLAELYRAAGRVTEARALLEEHWEAQERRAALRLAADRLMREPGSAHAHREVGRLCLERGMHGRAIVEFERALKLGPTSKETLPLLEQARARVSRAASPEE